MSLLDRIHLGASFHREHLPAEQRNGVITNINYSDQCVTVVYHNGEKVNYDWDELDYAWSYKYGGLFIPDR